MKSYSHLHRFIIVYKRGGFFSYAYFIFFSMPLMLKKISFLSVTKTLTVHLNTADNCAILYYFLWTSQLCQECIMVC